MTMVEGKVWRGEGEESANLRCQRRYEVVEKTKWERDISTLRRKHESGSHSTSSPLSNRRTERQGTNDERPVMRVNEKSTRCRAKLEQSTKYTSCG